MSTESSTRRAKQTSEAADRQPTKQELERQMELTRESLAETVGEIKETVEHQYDSVKHTVSGVLDYREQFKNEPLVWSLGALSAGFALGYTVGYGHKKAKHGKHSQLVAFADGMVDELSNMGQGLVVPALTAKIKELFGFDFSDLLEDVGGKSSRSGKRSSKRRPAKPKALKAGSRKRSPHKKSR